MARSTQVKAERGTGLDSLAEKEHERVVEVTIVNGQREADRLRGQVVPKLLVTGQFDREAGAAKAAGDRAADLFSLYRRGEQAGQREAAPSRKADVGAESRIVASARPQAQQKSLGNGQALGQIQQQGGEERALGVTRQARARLQRLLITLNYRDVTAATQAAIQEIRAKREVRKEASQAAGRKAPAK